MRCLLGVTRLLDTDLLMVIASKPFVLFNANGRPFLYFFAPVVGVLGFSYRTLYSTIHNECFSYKIYIFMFRWSVGVFQPHGGVWCRNESVASCCIVVYCVHLCLVSHFAVGSGNGFAPSRRQAIAWHGSLSHRKGGDELTRINEDKHLVAAYITVWIWTLVIVHVYEVRFHMINKGIAAMSFRSLN